MKKKLLQKKRQKSGKFQHLKARVCQSLPTTNLSAAKHMLFLLVNNFIDNYSNSI